MRQPAISPSDDVAVDVLIVGAGPAGYMAAVTLARYGVSFHIIDGRPERIQTGHAGGIQPRTMEVWHSMNLHHKIDIQGNHCSEMSFWALGANGKLERTHVGAEIKNATRFPYILAVPQKETERAFDEELNARGHFVDRPAKLIDFTYTDDAEFPVHALVKSKYTNITSTYRAKYMMGTDGGTSKVREILGFGSEKQGDDDVWCVADVVLDSNFPDLRRRSAIRCQSGAIMIIPNRNDGNRIYIQLTSKDLKSFETNGGENTNGSDHSNGTNNSNGVSNSNGVNHSNGVDHEDSVRLKLYGDIALLDLLKERARSILSPYKMEIKKLLWISQYRLRQRIVEEFWDHKRVFILGDACHTHSPKAAQGLNVSMADSYNLTWKLALVLKGRASNSLLDTYALERKQIAKQLIEFDAKWSHLFGRKDFLNNSAFHDVYDKAHGFTSGVGQQYDPGPLTIEEVSVPIAKNALEPLTPGRRLYTMKVIRHIDGTELDITDDMPSNGQWHIFVFAGNAIERGGLAPVTDWLASPESALSIFNKDAPAVWAFENVYSESAKNEERVVDMFFVHTGNHQDIEATELPAPLPQWRYRIYSDKDGVEHASHGVDVETGAIALVRPDGHISLVCGLDEGSKITDFLKIFLHI